jgi:hypothetical protein
MDLYPDNRTPEEWYVQREKFLSIVRRIIHEPHLLELIERANVEPYIPPPGISLEPGPYIPLAHR